MAIASDRGEATRINDATRVRRALTQLLEHETGAGPTTSAVAAAAAGRVLERLSERLSLVLGSIGVNALVLRAVVLSKPEFPFLRTHVVPLVRGEGVGEALRTCLHEQEPEVIKEASVTILVTVMSLLVRALGERLTWSLLKQTWPDALPPESEFQEDAG